MGQVGVEGAPNKGVGSFYEREIAVNLVVKNIRIVDCLRGVYASSDCRSGDAKGVPIALCSVCSRIDAVVSFFEMRQRL